jgi:hypothetical protein
MKDRSGDSTPGLWEGERKEEKEREKERRSSPLLLFFTVLL